MTGADGAGPSKCTAGVTPASSENLGWKGEENNPRSLMPPQWHFPQSDHSSPEATFRPGHAKRSRRPNEMAADGCDVSRARPAAQRPVSCLRFLLVGHWAGPSVWTHDDIEMGAGDDESAGPEDRGRWSKPSGCLRYCVTTISSVEGSVPVTHDAMHMSRTVTRNSQCSRPLGSCQVRRV